MSSQAFVVLLVVVEVNANNFGRSADASLSMLSRARKVPVGNHRKGPVGDNH